MSFTPNSHGGEYNHRLSQYSIPNYKIGFLPAPVPGLHSSWNNGGIIGGNGGQPTDKNVIEGTNFAGDGIITS